MPEPVSNKDIALTNMFEILQDNQSSYQNQENGMDLNTQQVKVRMVEQPKVREVHHQDSSSSPHNQVTFSKVHSNQEPSVEVVPPQSQLAVTNKRSF